MQKVNPPHPSAHPDSSALYGPPDFDHSLQAASDEDFENEESSDDDSCAEHEVKDNPPNTAFRSAATAARLFNEDGTVRTLIRAKKSAFVNALIHLDGKRFDFTGREYLLPIYDRNDKEILLKTARQVEKSTFLANNLTVSSAIKPYNKSLYVSPSHSQTRQFSNEKLKAAIDGSPVIQKYLQDHLVSSQVFEKGFTNGSYIFLRSAFRTADRARGISARHLCLDELQDFLISQIPVIKECTSHFPDATTFMAGTPKSFDNPIEVYWQETTQNEWLVPCSCGKWNFLDEKCIAPTPLYLNDTLPPGPVCTKCAKPIHVPSGRWVSLSPTKSIQGYRVPQLMVPWICGLKEQWLKLLWKRDNYPFGQFSNECLGLSYDSASKPITRDELIECCADYSLWEPTNLTPQIVQSANRSLILTAGVDWGEGNDGSERGPSGKLRTASYTVLTIGAYINQKVWKTFLIKKYIGREIDPDYVVADISRICQTLGVKLIGVDWGHGWGVNNVLIRKFGPDKVVQFQHLPKLKQRMKWDPIGQRYHLMRNFMMSELFFDLKHQLVQFPKWVEFEPYAKDILSIYSEYSEFRREIRYDHRASDPDDFFHSLLYGKLVSDIYLGKSRRYTKDVVNE